MQIGKLVDSTAGRVGVVTNVVDHADRDQRRDIHASAVKKDISERVVTHLPAGHIPGQGDDNHQPERRQLGAEIRE